MRELNARRQARGTAGEAYATRLLERAGYAILARNYRCRGGEIDVVARQGDEIVFVEVRTRRQGALVGPEESVTLQKQARVLHAAEHYLQAHELWERPWRVDLVALEVDRMGRVVRAEHLRSIVE